MQDLSPCLNSLHSVLATTEHFPKHTPLSMALCNVVPSAWDSLTANLSFVLQELSQASSFFRKLFLSCLAPTWIRHTNSESAVYTLILARTCHWFPISSSELSPCEGRTVLWCQHRPQQWEVLHFLTEAPCPSMLLRQLSSLVWENTSTTKGKFGHSRLIKAFNYF